MLASLALFAVNEFWVPDSDDLAKAILKRHQPPDPRAPGRNEYRNLCFNNTRDGRRWDIGVYNAETGEMINPQVYPIKQDGSKPWELRAERAQRIDGVWTFYNVRALQGGGGNQRCRRCRSCKPTCWPCRSSRKRRRRSTAKSRSGIP